MKALGDIADTWFALNDATSRALKPSTQSLLRPQIASTLMFPKQTPVSPPQASDAAPAEAFSGFSANCTTSWNGAKVLNTTVDQIAEMNAEALAALHWNLWIQLSWQFGPELAERLTLEQVAEVPRDSTEGVNSRVGDNSFPPLLDLCNLTAHPVLATTTTRSHHAPLITFAELTWLQLSLSYDNSTSWFNDSNSAVIPLKTFTGLREDQLPTLHNDAIAAFQTGSLSSLLHRRHHL